MLDFSFAVRIQYVKSDALIRRPGHERFRFVTYPAKIFNWFVVITFNFNAYLFTYSQDEMFFFI